MAAVNISNAMKQMDGVFGCKVLVNLESIDDHGHEVSFIKKNFLDWIRDIFSKKEDIDVNNAETMYALSRIQLKIKKVDDGQFEALVKKYEANPETIDFKEIRRTLQNLLKMQFPPIIYSRQAHPQIGLQSGAIVPSVDLKDVYRQNIRRAICLDTGVEIFRDGVEEGVTESNLDSLAKAFHEIPDDEAKKIVLYEPNFSIRKRFEKILLATPLSEKNAETTQHVPAAILSTDSYVNPAINKKPQTTIEENLTDDLDADWNKVTEIYTSTDTMRTQVNRELVKSFIDQAVEFPAELLAGKGSSLLAGKEAILDKEDWLNFYDNKVKAGSFQKNGVAQIIRGPNGEVSDLNLEAFCEILISLSKNGTALSINEDSESMRTRMYLELYENGLTMPELRPLNDPNAK